MTTRILSVVSNADRNDITGNVVKEKPLGFDYQVHYDRRTQQWSVQTRSHLHLIMKLGTSRFYYVDRKPYRFLRDAILQILLKDGVI